MQVFHPEFDTELAVTRLDKSRAGNQCWRESETLWSGSWTHHPAHDLIGRSAGNRAWFCWYNMLLIEHVHDNGWCRDSVYDKWRDIWHRRMQECDALPVTPEWLRHTYGYKIVSSHRSCLLAKDRTWYGQFNWPEYPTPPKVTHGVTGRWPYVWPHELQQYD